MSEDEREIPETLNYYSLDYNFLTNSQKAVVSCFIRRNNLVENWVIPNRLDDLICLVTDFDKEELAEAFHIEVSKFGKARQPVHGQLEDKFLVLKVFRALLKEQPRVYSDESLADFFENSTESDQNSQNVTAIFNNGERQVTASNLRTDGDSKNIADRDHLIISIVNPAAQTPIKEKPEVLGETTLEKKPKVLVHQKLAQPLLIANHLKQEPRFLTSKLNTIELIDEHIENQSTESETHNPGRETIDSQDEEGSGDQEVQFSKRLNPKKSSTAKKPKQKKNFLGKMKSKILGVGKSDESDDSESIYSDNYQEHDTYHLTAENENNNTNTLNSSVRRIGEKQIIPIWRMATSAEDQFTALENYIMDLQYVGNMGLELNEKALIFQSINASGRTNLLHTMPTEACESVQKFIKYLHKAYGRTPIDMRSRLNNLKRDPHETMHSYLSKVMRVYYMAHNKTPPTIKQLSTAKDMEAERQDLVYHFLQGLQHPVLARELKLRMHEIDLQDLPDIAKQLYEVLDQPKSTEVNNVDTPLEKEFKEMLRVNEVNFVKQNFRNQRGQQSNNRYGNQYNHQPDHQNDQYQQNFGRHRTGRFQNGNRSNQHQQSRNFRSLKDVTCYRCFQKGHYANTCKSTPQPKQHNADNNTAVKCYNCGNYGHKKQNCRPNKNGYSNQNE